METLVEICAVTKTVDAETANLVVRTGIKKIGENRVQSMLEKRDKLDPSLDVHLIGRLQLNKVKYLPGKVQMVESVDRIELAQELSRRFEKSGITLPVLAQVNIAREEQKGGLDESQLLDFLDRASVLPGIQICGLMAIMPLVDDAEELRPYFKRMRQWFERLRDKSIPGVKMETLSMGMTNDCLVAAQEGATMVRLGRAIFSPV